MWLKCWLSCEKYFSCVCVYVCVCVGGGDLSGNTSPESEDAESMCILEIFLYSSQLASRSKSGELRISCLLAI